MTAHACTKPEFFGRKRGFLEAEPEEQGHIDRHREHANRQTEALNAAMEQARLWRPHAACQGSAA